MEKGTYGYLAYKKGRNLRWALLFAVIVAAFVLAGLIIWGTRLNWLMIPGMLCVIPFAIFFVSYVALRPFDTGDEEKYAELGNFEEAGMLLSDLVLVDEKGGRASMDFVVIYPNGVAAYQSTKKDQRDMITITVNDTLKRRGIPMRILVFRNWDDFVRRITEMNVPQSEEETKRVNRAKDALLSLCM